jgi:hypothetical protein
MALTEAPAWAQFCPQEIRWGKDGYPWRWEVEARDCVPQSP